MSIFSRLNDLWQQPERIWARTPTANLSIGELQQKTAAKLVALQRAKATKCLISRRDKIEFTSDLLACAIAGINVILPANAQSESLQNAYDQSHADAALGDMDNALSVDNSVTVARLGEIDDITVTVFTSGSTGNPKAIGKPLSRYINEVETHQALWGETFENAVFISSVSHQHVYGLLFAVLLPLNFSHVIWGEEIHFEERLHYLIQQFDATIFVASPAILTRLSVSLAKPNGLRAIFSSGGPLTTVQAKSVESHLNAPCLRIYGSSETGGVAWQNSDSDNWTIFSGIGIRQVNGLLCVDSDYAYQSPYATADRVDIIDDSHFRLLGRADDIVKIGEKRVALPAVEKALQAHPNIVAAKVIALPTPRNCLGAVLVLDDAGKRAQQAAPRAFYQSLRKLLSQQFEPVTLPKYFRCVAQLPENAQGKILKRDLLALFI